MELLPLDWAVWDHVADLYLECVPRLGTLPGGWSRHTRRAAGYLELAQDVAIKAWGEEAMAKNGKNADFQISQWVNVSLDDTAKEDILRIGADWAAIFQWMGERVAAGYRFSVAWDDYSQACQASIICRASEDPNYTLAMSSRHPDLETALVSLMYKDAVITKGEWAAFADTVRKDYSWD